MKNRDFTGNYLYVHYDGTGFITDNINDCDPLLGISHLIFSDDKKVRITAENKKTKEFKTVTLPLSSIPSRSTVLIRLQVEGSPDESTETVIDVNLR